jgi:hypothetical protein
MFEWLFRPSCPCDPAAKVWVEQRLAWLADEFPDSAFSGGRVILPTPAFFPDAYDGTPKTVRKLLHRVCEYMDVVPDLVKLRLTAAAPPTGLVSGDGYEVGGIAGTYSETDDKFLIRIDRGGLGDPMSLVGTMAHELAHVRLLGENRVSAEEYDNELLTDLTVVHLGLGLFLANAPRAWVSGMTLWPGTKLRKPEYMSAPMYGWALAHLALWRCEEKPAWATYLVPSARAEMRQGLRYLHASGDSTYKPLPLG